MARPSAISASTAPARTPSCAGSTTAQRAGARTKTSGGPITSPACAPPCGPAAERFQREGRAGSAAGQTSTLAQLHHPSGHGGEAVALVEVAICARRDRGGDGGVVGWRG